MSVGYWGGGGSWGNLAKLRANGAAAMDLRMGVLRAVGERTRRCACVLAAGGASHSQERAGHVWLQGCDESDED